MEEKNQEKNGLFDAIWKTLASVKLAIFVIIALASLSIIGTIVEQQADPAKNIALLAKFFGDALAPTVYNVFAKLGFMDMYGSWWFVSLLVLFSVNLIVCSIDRIPKTWKFIQRPLKPVSENAIRALPVRKELSLKTSLNIARDEVVNILNASKYRFFEATEGSSVQLYSQKGKYARLGAYVVHLSIILIFIGAIIGIRFGFKGYLNLPEGRSSSLAYISPTESIPLGFTIKCNWYNTSYYENSSTPLEFQSELVIIDNGRETMKKVIEVNSPLTYKGITFFQSSYGMMLGVLDEFVEQDSPGGGRINTLQPTFSKFPNLVGRFILRLRSENGQDNTVTLRRGDSFEIPNTSIRGTVVGFSPTLDRDRMTNALGTNSYFKEQLVNPAVAIEVEAPGRNKFVGWFLKNQATVIIPEADHELEFVDFRGIEYTGLQVAKDPGVWLIYLACIIMSVALYICFFISHRKLWIHIANDKNSVRITAGGSVNRSRLNFEKEIDRILSDAVKAIEGRTKK